MSIEQDTYSDVNKFLSNLRIKKIKVTGLIQFGIKMIV